MYSNPPAPAQGHAPAQRSSQQWDPRDQPPPSQYPPPPHSQPYPPQNAQGGPPRPDMAAIHPQQYQQPDYRLPPPPNHQYYPPDPYNRPPMQNGMDPYRQPMPNGGQDQYRPPVQQPAQSAPRQRTAIACKYCRRRKIRCSGFENSEDGRCSNCVRFSQECVFTPVSSQAQAFVPAQALWGRQNGRGPPPNQPLYGAFGQPIPQSMYPPPPPPQGYNQLPSPTTPYPPPPQQHMYQNQPYPPPQQGGPDPNRRRGRDEPHSATLPPPNPAAASHMAGHREGEGQAYTYPDPTPHHQGAVSPATSSHSYSSHPQQPYYAPEPPRRTSPQSAGYGYDNRASSSPHAPAGYPPASGPPTAPYQPAPSRTDGRTPPPVSTAAAAAAGGRPGMSIHDIVSENGNNGHSPGERSTADNDMVSALNRRPPNGGAPRRS